MSGRRYTATLDSVVISATSDLYEIVPDTATTIEILEFYISQETLIRNAQSEGNSINFIIDHTTEGDNTAIIIESMSLGDAAFGGSITKNLVTLATGGSPTIVNSYRWLNRIPFGLIFTPETNRIISPDKRMVIRLADITTTITVDAILIFQEFGG